MKTIEAIAWSSDSCNPKPVPKKRLRNTLGLTNKSFNEYLASLDLMAYEILEWNQVIDITSSYLWVRVNFGYHSKAQYLKLKELAKDNPDLIKATFAAYGVNLEQKLEELMEKLGNGINRN